MNNIQLQDKQLNLLILMEEFRYWDACRNKVPQPELEKINFKLTQMKKHLITPADELHQTCM